MGLWPKPAMVSLDEIEKTDSVLLVCGATPFCMLNCSRWYWRKTEDQAKPGRAKLFSIVSASIFSQFFMCSPTSQVRLKLIFVSSNFASPTWIQNSEWQRQRDNNRLLCCYTPYGCKWMILRCTSNPFLNICTTFLILILFWRNTTNIWTKDRELEVYLK